MKESAINRPASPKLANQAWESLFRVQVQFMRQFSAAEQWKQGVSITEYDVLYSLSKAGAEGQTQRELNQHVLLAQSSLSRLIDRLTERGLVECQPNPQDARSIRVKLTDLGKQKQRELGLKHAKHVHQLMADRLSSDQLQKLLELTQSLLQTPEQTDPTAQIQAP